MSIKTPVSITQVSFGNGPPMNYSISDATGRDLSWEEICAALNERDRLRDANESLQARLREAEDQHVIEKHGPDGLWVKIHTYAKRAAAAEAKLAAVRESVAPFVHSFPGSAVGRALKEIAAIVQETKTAPEPK